MYLKIMHSSGSSRSRGLLNRGKGYHNLTVKAVNLGAKVPNEVLHTISSYLHLMCIFSKLLTGFLRHAKGSIMLGWGNSFCKCMLMA